MEVLVGAAKETMSGKQPMKHHWSHSAGHEHRQEKEGEKLHDVTGCRRREANVQVNIATRGIRMPV